ncbi:uncharacterized protein LOC132740439 [Ruditapes philippinarum]|uniref:uncharacterized protein LOC132740439 n=1 Tax=Ruditapes philippinarum TaxID=129788 RepID=UPI00295B993A|nr:uncharacterized protein LOC132740439 [Ruditapes philippinarum]
MLSLSETFLHCFLPRVHTQTVNINVEITWTLYFKSYRHCTYIDCLEMNKFLVAGLVVCVLATIVCILSTSIPYWLYGHSKSYGIETSVASGLWQVCVRSKIQSSTETSCFKNSDLASWMKAVRAMMILGILFMAMSAAIACLYLVKFYTNNHVYICTVFTAALGGVFVIVGFVVYASEFNKENQTAVHLSGAFYLAVLSAVLAFVAASLFVISRRSAGGYNTI